MPGLGQVYGCKSMIDFINVFQVPVGWYHFPL